MNLRRIDNPPEYYDTVETSLRRRIIDKINRYSYEVLSPQLIRIINDDFKSMLSMYYDDLNFTVESHDNNISLILNDEYTKDFFTEIMKKGY